jgi:CRISPR system Cascade subunit CasE
VYRDWLSRELGRGEAARLAQYEMRSFKRERLLRRDHGAERTSHHAERPDAVLGGVLEIADGEAFAGLLSRGLGRHRAFGFGMLLLRPAPPC